MQHTLKHQYINDAMTGAKYLFPTFNRNNNEFLLPAIEQTGIKVGRNGFEKDKSGEKLIESDEDPLELRTDGTDAWDTLFIGIRSLHRPSFSLSWILSLRTCIGKEKEAKRKLICIRSFLVIS